MSAGKIYMLSVTVNKKTETGLFSSALNTATSFVRDEILGILPLDRLLPHPNPKGLVYQINEIDRAAFDQYLLKSNVVEKLTGKAYLVLFIGLLWGIVTLLGVRILGYLIFMGKYKNSHPLGSLILSICLIVAGVIIMNYNTSGLLFLYLLSTFLIGSGLSEWDLGIDSNKSGCDKLKKEDYSGAVSDFEKAITAAPFTSVYFFNLGLAYGHLQDWQNSIANFKIALRRQPYFNLTQKIKENLSIARMQVAIGTMHDQAEIDNFIRESTAKREAEAKAAVEEDMEAMMMQWMHFKLNLRWAVFYLIGTAVLLGGGLLLLSRNVDTDLGTVLGFLMIFAFFPIVGGLAGNHIGIGHPVLGVIAGIGISIWLIYVILEKLSSDFGNVSVLIPFIVLWVIGGILSKTRLWL
jgi:tetratricopeptide (TPR) repeat protein